jgi:hypothetical protein
MLPGWEGLILVFEPACNSFGYSGVTIVSNELELSGFKVNNSQREGGRLSH